MSTKQLGAAIVTVDPEGFMTDPAQWTPEIAKLLAQEEGIPLDERRWKVIEFIRKDGQENGSAPTIRRITKLGGVSTKDLYELFPGGPAKKAAKIAGYPKPHGCI